MSNLKESKYNHTVKLDEQYSIVYNSLKRTISKLDNRYLEDLKNHCLSDIHASQLSELGILIGDNVDEENIIDLRHLEDVMGSQLDLTILPTENCNLRCKYCYESFQKGKMSNENQRRIIRFLKKNLYKYTELNVSWFGGEPTTAMNVIENLSTEMIQCCEKRSIQYQAGITTNGYNLTYENFMLLLKLKVRTFQVTLDGTQEYQDRFKRTVDDKPTFERVFNNLKQIRDRCKSNTFSLIIRTNISSDSLEDIPKILKLYKEQFGNDKRFSFYFRPVGDWGGDRVKEITDSVVKKENYFTVYKRLAESNIRLNYMMYYTELTNDIDICYAARKNSYIIGSDLQIYKCSVIFDDPLNQIGFIDENGVMVLDESKQAKWIMTGLKGGNIKKCKSCILKGPCYNSTCIADQVRGKTEYNCPHMYKSLDDFLLLLSTSEKYCKIYDY